MKASIIASLLAAGVALAAPAPISASNVEKRAEPSILACNDRNFSGYCQTISSPASECDKWLVGDFDDQISSVRPDENSFCYFFVDRDCSTDGDFFHVGYPGVADLSVTPVNGPEGSTRDFENKISSYFCVPNA
ncbi:unnamed protein product [Periconia digitata]|uniref:Uncharacterized protein n=1 Tax=Periconia digitata TaxID=1303443 RepID=A0A9W4XRB8_9PLEO|nr:unnamed protein product [Periconia digitata]